MAVLETTLVSMAAMAIYGIVGYIKAKKENSKEKFDPIKLSSSILVGLVIGVVSSFAGIQLDENVIGQILQVIGIGILAINSKKAAMGD